MPFKLRYRILNCYVIPILMYGCENWILMKSDIKKLEAAEMWFLRRMQKISWKEKKSNQEIVKDTIGSRNLLAEVMRRQMLRGANPSSPPRGAPWIGSTSC